MPLQRSVKTPLWFLGQNSVRRVMVQRIAAVPATAITIAAGSERTELLGLRE